MINISSIDAFYRLHTKRMYMYTMRPIHIYHLHSTLVEF
jgi:hypothetical protein